MCGIVGLMDFSQSAVCQKEMSIFMQMLHCNAVRGMHGTGIFAADRDGENYRLRAGGPPHALVGNKEFEKFEKWVGSRYVRFLVGHNRFATRGGISTETTHPFRNGDITLVHNGTLDTYAQLPDAKKYAVDSEAICHAISVQGAEKTVQSLQGAWTLVWFDAATSTLNFLRNKERPLYMARLKKEDQIVFASEYSMLSWILGRNEVYDYEIAELPADQWYSYGLNSIKPHVKELKGKSVYFSEYGWEGFGGTARGDATGTGKESVEADKKVVQLPLLPVLPKKSGTSTSDSGSGSGHSTKRRSLQEKSSGGAAASAGSKGHWIAADSIHTITKAAKVTVLPMEAKAVTDSEGKQDLFEVQALANDFPDVQFICYVKGYASVQTLLEAQHGMRCDVKSILRSMASTVEHPHRVYLSNPEPMWTEEPTVPAHAHVGD